MAYDKQQVLENPEFRNIYNCLLQGKIPKKFCVSGMNMSYAFYARSMVTELGMWAIVDMTWTKKLAKMIGKMKVLEIMAGNGWLAKVTQHTPGGYQ